MRAQCLGILVLLAFPALAWAACSGSSPTLTAASAARNDVNDCVTAASDGDTVLIPNGSASWTTGISTTKQIWIRAQNYTPTDEGNTTRSVLITNNATEPLISLTSGNAYHVRVSGIHFKDDGTGDNNHVELLGNGSKVPLVDDCLFEVKHRIGTSVELAVLDWTALGGVLWNSRFVGLVIGSPDGVGPHGASFIIKKIDGYRDWDTASTLGTLDTNGAINVYIEDVSCQDVGQWPDCDRHCRAVFRHNTIDGCSGTNHGSTSDIGGRQIEFYDNVFSVTSEDRNHAGRYFWLRSGTAVFTDNLVNNASFPGAYGNVDQVAIFDDAPPQGAYPIAMQPAGGHNGTGYVIDPIYLWNQSGARAYTWAVENGWETYVVEGRDLFVNVGAKPGYMKYTYPHPLRAVGEGEGPPSSPLAAPVALQIIMQ